MVETGVHGYGELFKLPIGDVFISRGRPGMLGMLRGHLPGCRAVVRVHQLSRGHVLLGERLVDLHFLSYGHLRPLGLARLHHVPPRNILSLLVNFMHELSNRAVPSILWLEHMQHLHLGHLHVISGLVRLHELFSWPLCRRNFFILYKLRSGDVLDNRFLKMHDLLYWDLFGVRRVHLFQLCFRHVAGGSRGISVYHLCRRQVRRRGRHFVRELHRRALLEFRSRFLPQLHRWEVFLVGLDRVF